MKPEISARNLSKYYKLGVINRKTLVDEARYWWSKVRGRDPREHFSKVGYTATEARRIDAEKEGRDGFWALRDVSFDIQAGEVVGIIGKNGAGKSTLLKILTRITEPTSGEAIIRGRVGSLLEVGTGFHPELTGRENVYMNGTILGMKKPDVDKNFDAIVGFSELEKFIDTPVKRYSSGMYVRLAFAVAAHLDPEILIIDEVLAVGDAGFQKKCLGKMGDVAKEGRTILFVSHNMASISTLCSRCILLNNGEIVQNGSPSDVVLSYYDSIIDSEKNINKANGDEFCLFVSASLVNAQKETVKEVRLDKELRIIMIYDILQKTTDRCVPNIHLLTASGQYVFCLNSPGIEPMEPGRYKAECTIPPFLLNEGAFTVGVAVTSYHDCKKQYTVNFFEQNILSFNVVDPKDSDEWNYGFVNTVPGVIRPRLNWKIQEISKET